MAKTKKDIGNIPDEIVKETVLQTPVINPAAFIKVKALVDTPHLKKDKVYQISGADAIHLIKKGIIEQYHDID